MIWCNGPASPSCTYTNHRHRGICTTSFDLNGLTGMSIVDATVAGERDAAVLAKRRPPHIKASEETIRKSLVGNWRAEHLFTLKRSRDWYRAYQQQIVAYEGYSSARTTTSAGGALLRKGMRKGSHRAGQRFRLAANSLHHNHTPWGNYLRRMKAKPRPRRSDHGNGSQDRHHFLHHGQKSGGIRCHPVGATRRSAPATLRGQTQAAGSATRLPAGAGRRKTCRLTRWRKKVQGTSSPKELGHPFRSTSTAFSPPNANEFESAHSICADRAWLGTTSRSHSGST